ncbi:hypothetical protein [Petrachloros mirabilis]
MSARLDPKKEFPGSTLTVAASYGNANIISVAAIDKFGTLVSWWSYGSTSVDPGAPGVSIWSTVPEKKGSFSYSSCRGISMATLMSQGRQVSM